jgi:hypothetical protein
MKAVCRACGEQFSTLRNFERHRVGDYDIAAPGYGRRYLSTDEMAADPRWKLNRFGRWGGNRPPLPHGIGRDRAIASTGYSA